MNKLLGRHIFRSGTWNGVPFSDKDLDDIVTNFERLREVHHVPLKFGHNKDQPITDGQPAIGWIERVYRKGSDLFADFANVPSIVMDAIKARRYRTVSVEVIKNAKLNGEEIKTWFLDAVALLGADQPAVSGLNDLADLTLSRATFVDGQRLAFSQAGNFDSSQFEESAMDEKTLSAAIEKHLAPIQAQMAKLTDENVALKSQISQKDHELAQLKAEAKDREKAENASQIKASRDAAKEILDTAVKQKAITPAQREGLEVAFGVNEDERVVTLSLDALKSASGWQKPGRENVVSGMFSRDEDNDVSDIPLDQQVVMATRKVLANKPDLSYADAQLIALGADPKLAKAYADSNGVRTADGGVQR